MYLSTVCGVVLLATTAFDLTSAGFLHANQTVKMELTGQPAKGKTISCTDAIINDLERLLLDYLNAYARSTVTDTNCEFLLGGNTNCDGASIQFNIILTCEGKRASGSLLNNVEQQKMAITKIMGRTGKEVFTSGGVSITVELFKQSEVQNITPSPTCSDDCTKVQQGPVTLCDCPYVLWLSCNIPAVLVQITKKKSINGSNSTCAQIDTSMHSINEQLLKLAGPISYGGLQFQVVTNDISNSFSCDSTANGLVELTMQTSVIVNTDAPHCSDNTSCIQQFNVWRLAIIKSFFQFTLSFAPHMQSLSTKEVILSEGTPDVDVTLLCGNETINSDGACCSPGCDVCYNNREPIHIVLVVNFNVDQLSGATCPQLNFTKVTTSIRLQLGIGAILVHQAGGRLVICNQPVVNCTEMGGSVNSVAVRVPLILTLAPGVTVNSQEELIELISTTIKGLIEGAGQVSVGGKYNVSTNTFSVEIKNECPDCAAGSYLKDDSCHECPVGQYTDKPYQSECLHCPDGHTTDEEGATSVNQCKKIPTKCPPGHYSNNGYSPCTACPVGKYQQFSGKKSCISCPSRYTTKKSGSKSIFKCVPNTSTSPPPPTIKTFPAKTVTDNFFTSPNYPNNYPVLQKRTYLLQCNNNLKLTVMILDLSLASGDSLTIHGASYRGPTHLNVPEAKVYSFSNATVTFISDGHNTRKGFRIVYGCYLNKYTEYLDDLAIDCEVRKYLKDKDDVMRKLLKVLTDELPLATIVNDEKFAPIKKVIVDGPVAC